VKRAAVLLAVLLAAGCGRGGPIDGADLALRISPPPAAIELGRSFPLAVTRVWSKDLEPDPWTDAVLLPLVVRLDEKTLREDGVHVEETRRYRAYAFEPGVATVPPVTIAAAPKAGGPARTATAPGFSVEVKKTLDAKTAGPPELPDVIPPSRCSLWTLLVLAGIALLVGLSTRRAIKKSVAGLPGVPESPRDRARDRIRRLRAADPRTAVEDEAWHVAAAAAVREWLAEERGMRALEMTTEEMLAATGAPSGREALARVLLPCDLVKFARHESSAAERAGVLAAAESLLG
jgi:hypothetical protein